MKKPNRFFAPIIIAGITVGFLASAYKFVIAKSNVAKQKSRTHSQDLSSAQQHHPET